tara:strand:- start:2076 stop:2258 length:183 start_codon:yes stop_codon:yes gene_type:complete
MSQQDPTQVLLSILDDQRVKREMPLPMLADGFAALKFLAEQIKRLEELEAKAVEDTKPDA